MGTKKVQYYAPAEERLNILSHGLGFLLSIVGLILLIIRSGQFGHPLHMISVVVFGLSLIMLYAASTLYHSARKEEVRYRLKIFDHAAIYVLIAGTYTPFSLITLQGKTGWIIFGVVWGGTLAGVILKLFFTGKYKLVSTLMYVGMGWIIIFAIQPMVANLPADGVLWLAVGGLSYTVGAVFYSIKKLPFNHAIFHVFVLIGSFCHFMAVYGYVIPK
jgi:hemolysin III